MLPVGLEATAVDTVAAGRPLDSTARGASRCHLHTYEGGRDDLYTHTHTI